MITTLEDFPVELFYDIFIYFQLHEICTIFSNLNSRITAIVENIPSISVHLGSSGMNIETTNLYYRYLSRTNISSRLTSLCVSDRFSIDNGLWFAEHGSTFINLRCLFLVDIKRMSFEVILNSLPPIHSLNTFIVRFSRAERAVCTFQGVPEGAYHEQIFRLFPSLRICHLYFRRFTDTRIASPFILPREKAFIPIQSSLLSLRSLTLQDCSPCFLSHLFEHLPQLQQFSCDLRNTSWVPKQHPLREDYKNNFLPVNKRLAPNLRRLKMKWVERIINVKSIERLFECDVLFSLANFTLLGQITNLNVLHHVLSKLSSQCVYRFDLKWHVRGVVPPLNTSNILFNTFEQLKGPVPIELELLLQENSYFVKAMTLPRMDSSLCVYSYISKTRVDGQSRWPYNKHCLSSHLLQCDDIRMSEHDAQMNDEFLSLSSYVIRWDRIKSMTIAQPSNPTYLRAFFSQAINLRILTLYYPTHDDYPRSSKKTPLIDLIDDESSCNILMAHGLKQLNLEIDGNKARLLKSANRIVERLPRLEVIELECGEDEVIEMIHILINGLSRLNFFTLVGCEQHALFYEKKMRSLCNANTRPFRMEVAKTMGQDTLFIWSNLKNYLGAIKQIVFVLFRC